MKKNIFIFLFVFALLFIVFQYVNSKRYFTEVTKTTEKLVGENHFLQDSIRKLIIEKSDLQYFDLSDNTYGKDYFAEIGIENPLEFITTSLLKTNNSKGDHPLIGYQPINQQFQINKIKTLNHRWIICDFSDGIYWGELLLRYDIDNDKKITFTVFDELLYPKDE